jgi:protein-L-isoaspartate(D-aspartate) O-methyltransferase
VVEGPVVSPLPQFSGARRRLVEELRAKGIADTAVLAAVERTPRHAFVPTGMRHRAYEDAALLIGSGQTISQPFVHARSLELLKLQPTDRVLEIGTGSGYQTVLLSHLAREVYSVERIEALLDRAREAVGASGATNVRLLCADGTGGWPEYAPYDAIVVSAGAPEVPQPLLDQLADGGRLLTPVGDRDEQRLVLVVRRGTRFDRQSYDPVRFVPLVGEHGWDG